MRATVMYEAGDVRIEKVPDAAEAVREILDDPVSSTVLTPWLPLFEGPLHQARAAHSWGS